MNLGGYANRVARIDLSRGQANLEGLNEEDARNYIGARGLGVKYLLDHGPEIDPMSDDNMLAVMSGPLSGTDVKMSGRLAVVTKAPLTGTVIELHLGGWTAAKLKWAGYDGAPLYRQGRPPDLRSCDQRRRDPPRRLGPVGQDHVGNCKGS